ncbi:MAG: ribosome silencing factor [Chloroflexota bacterium]
MELAHLLVDAVVEKKGSDILLLDIRDQAVFADYFLLCTGETEPQLRALSQSALGTAKQNAGTSPLGTEGEPANGWVLLDFGDVVAHFFLPRTREYYDLESLWHDGRVVLRMQ